MSTLFQGHQYLATITGRGHHVRVLRVATQLHPVECIAKLDCAKHQGVVDDLREAGRNMSKIDEILALVAADFPCT